MDFNSYYFHAIQVIMDRENDINKTIRVLNEILKSDNILCKRLQNNPNLKANGFNGLDYISLCDYEQRNAKPFENNPYYIGYSAYNTFVSRSLSLIIDKTIKTIKPELVAPVIFDWDSLEQMKTLGNHKTNRFSDLPDELQVKNCISLAKIKGITIPFQYICYDESTHINYSDMVIIFFEKLSKILEDYQKDFPIYYLVTGEIVKTTDDVSLILKRAI